MTIYEYIRHGWTYHAKGIWLSQFKDNESSQTHNDDDNNDVDEKKRRGHVVCTIIGSSNLGRRSLERDLEVGCVIWRGENVKKSSRFDEVSIFFIWDFILFILLSVLPFFSSFFLRLTSFSFSSTLIFIFFFFFLKIDIFRI